MIYKIAILHNRRLIQFGLVKEFVRRLHKFPVLLMKPKQTDISKTQHAAKGKQRESQVDKNKLQHLEKYDAAKQCITVVSYKHVLWFIGFQLLCSYRSTGGWMEIITMMKYAAKQVHIKSWLSWHLDQVNLCIDTSSFLVHLQVQIIWNCSHHFWGFNNDDDDDDVYRAQHHDQPSSSCD